jgi:hypothetical protein
MAQPHTLGVSRGDSLQIGDHLAIAIVAAEAYEVEEEPETRLGLVCSCKQASRSDSMLRLTATFKVSLASPLFVNRPPRQEGVRTVQELRYPVRIDDSDVEIALVEAYHAMTIMDRQVFFDKATEAALSPYFDERRQVRSSVGGFANLL